MKAYKKEFEKLIVCYLFLNILLTGCATKLEHKPMILRSETPEVTGKPLGHDVSVYFGNTQSRVYAELDSDLFGVQDSSEARIRSSLTFGANGKLGVTSFMDIYTRLTPVGLSSIGTKIQLLGLGKKQQGWKISASTEIGISNKDTVNSEKDLERKLSIKLRDVSLNIGYRFSPHLITYVNNYYSVYDIDGTLSRSSNTFYATKGISEGYGASFGVKQDIGKEYWMGMFKGASYINYEFGFVRLNWLNTTDFQNNVTRNNVDMERELLAVGISVGHSW